MAIEFSRYQPQAATPTDFPKVTERSSLGGAVTKFSARQIEGRYIVGNTAEETRERYVACCSLLSDLIIYCDKKRAQDSAWSTDALLERVENGLKGSPQLELTHSELKWVLRELSIQLHGLKQA